MRLTRFQFFLSLVLALFILWGVGRVWQRKSIERQIYYDPLIRPVAARLSLDPLLVRAIIWRESRFDPEARGLNKERGLMQVTPGVAAEWAQIHHVPPIDPDALFDPATNIAIGSWYFARMLHHWDGVDQPAAFALAEYNAGRSNVLRWVDPSQPASARAMESRITYPATRRYVNAILNRYAAYARGYFRPPWLGWIDRFTKPADLPTVQHSSL